MGVHLENTKIDAQLDFLQTVFSFELTNPNPPWMVFPIVEQG
jgi:hypothetical protein